MDLVLLGGPVMEHLNGICEPHIINCLIATQACSNPGTGVVNTAHRGGEHASTMSDWAEPADKAAALILSILL